MNQIIDYRAANQPTSFNPALAFTAQAQQIHNNNPGGGGGGGAGSGGGQSFFPRNSLGPQAFSQAPPYPGPSKQPQQHQYQNGGGGFNLPSSGLSANVNGALTNNVSQLPPLTSKFFFFTYRVSFFPSRSKVVAPFHILNHLCFLVLQALSNSPSCVLRPRHHGADTSPNTDQQQFPYTSASFPNSSSGAVTAGGQLGATQSASPFHAASPRATAFGQFSPPVQSPMAAPPNQIQAAPQTPAGPQSQPHTPMSPEAHAREKARIEVLLDINNELLQEMHSLQMQGKGGASTQEHAALMRQKGLDARMGSDEFVQ